MRQSETLSGMRAVPMTYIIDQEGKVVEAYYDHEEGWTRKVPQELEL